MKLTETLRYPGSRVVGYAEDVVYDDEVLATHELVIEKCVISEGPKLFLRIYPVAKTNLHTLRK